MSTELSSKPQPRRRPTADAVLELVADVEQRLQHARLDATSPHRRAYRVLDTWLIEESYLNRLIFRRESLREQPLPGLEFTSTAMGLCWLMWKRVAARRHHAKCSAPAIRRKKTNIRALYLGAKPFSTKIVLDQTPQRLSRLEKEIKARERASSAGELNIPALLEHSLNSNPAFYAEEIIWGRACREADAGLISSNLFPGLARFYRAMGVSWHSVHTVVAPKFLARLERAMQHVKWNSHWCQPHHFLKVATQIVQSDECVPCSFCHGDLHPRNIIVTPGADVYLVDWEAAQQRPIIFDLFKMTWVFDWGRDRAEELIRALPPTHGAGPVLPFSRQLLLANLAAIAVRQAHVQNHKLGGRGTSSLVDNFTDLFGLASRLIDEKNYR